MTDNNHPITPPPELMQEWFTRWKDHRATVPYDEFVVTQAARWGSDQELDACCEWLETGPYGFSIEATAPSMTKRLRAARRPKPPSLKEQALKELAWVDENLNMPLLNQCDAIHTIRRALESLPS